MQQHQRYVQKRGANHTLHVILSICTCGIWAITGWPIAAAMGRKTVTTVPTYQPPPQAMPPQQGYGYPPQGAAPPQQQGWQQPPAPPYGQQPPAAPPQQQVTWGQPPPGAPGPQTPPYGGQWDGRPPQQ